MKTSNNSPADKEAAKTDTPNALISDNDLLKFFNLERENVQDFSITHRKDGMYVNITLNKDMGSVSCMRTYDKQGEGLHG